MRIGKERVIYNNYNLWEDYEQDAREYLRSECAEENPTDSQIWEEIDFLDSINWDADKEQLEEFFNDGSKWILQGTVERWDGTFRGGFIFDNFMEMFYKAAEDCNYIKFYDINGRFYFMCSHHDGTNLFEIKKVTDAGIAYYERWEEAWSDKRSEEYIHNKIMEKYSTLPHFAHKVYGVNKIEYQTVSDAA